MEPTPPAPDPDREPETAAFDPESPILLRPVPSPDWPKAISTMRVLTGVQVVLVMICGNCSFGFPLLAAISWAAERFNWNEDAAGFAIPLAWAVGFAAIFTYAYFTNRWAGRADRRARTTIIIGTSVLVGFTAVTIPFTTWAPGLIMIILGAAAPSLIIQAIVLRCVYGREGRRWFDSGEAARMDGSA
ncbi:MFS transporter [Glycomyces rhizosphaerae]|uniref:MFS transporter n=1 Tax=Glycomyces rhizosphaerae TaxID=2054422 RepID=A0ABV7Q470_9ACTN